jgi:hypothetical protein
MIPEPPKDSLAARLKDFSAYTAVGSFLLYLFGYLALRFHITALGVVTDLNVFDERYLFAGAKFFVMLGFCLPFLALIGVPAALLVRFLSRRLPPHARKRVSDTLRRPAILLWFSLLLALLVIQIRMNACLSLANLPFATRPPEPAWLGELLRTHDTIDLTAFFAELLLYAAVVCWPVIAASRLPLPSGGLKTLFAAASVLAVLTVLLVPVNFGLVVMPYQMARTVGTGKTPLAPGQQAWLLWEGKEWMNFLTRSAAGVSVVAIPVKEIDRIEVKGSDSLFDVLYGNAGGGK